MRDETPEHPRRLRSGLSTGTCATAAALAAARLLLLDERCDRVEVILPRGERVQLDIQGLRRLSSDRARAATIKDAGDDPDVTHGACIFCRLSLEKKSGMRFEAGPGVGRITRPGLPLPVGEPAINPVPRRMLQDNLMTLARTVNYRGGFHAQIGVVDGAALAKKTLNGRLGIVGGLSILGTTGIVRPFSCSAFIASIHQSIDVAHANRLTHLAACTGSNSERFIREHLHLPELALIEMGDFAGAVLKHLRGTHTKLSICGGFGKLSKLAAGHMSLHSRDSAVDFDFLTREAKTLGASAALCKKLHGANTSMEVLQHCTAAKLPLAERICELARKQAERTLKREDAVSVYCISRERKLLAAAL